MNTKFSTDKFEGLRYYPGCTTALENNYQAPDNTVIEEKVHLRGLGEELNNDLFFSVHIQTTFTAASKLAVWALQTFSR